MRGTREVGQVGEEMARRYLQEQGLKFVAANWLCKTGEIDLVMKDEEECLVFVEVRMRRETQYGEGLETVARDKQRKLIRTAQYYQQKEGWWGDVRFDVVSIAGQGEGAKIEHIEYAFEVNS
jgi:putative endonuclease